jgi:hypothetical protein
MRTVNTQKAEVLRSGVGRQRNAAGLLSFPLQDSACFLVNTRQKDRKWGFLVKALWSVTCIHFGNPGVWQRFATSRAISPQVIQPNEL